MAGTRQPIVIKNVEIVQFLSVVRHTFRSSYARDQYFKSRRPSIAGLNCRQPQASPFLGKGCDYSARASLYLSTSTTLTFTVSPTFTTSLAAGAGTALDILDTCSSPCWLRSSSTRQPYSCTVVTVPLNTSPCIRKKK